MSAMPRALDYAPPRRSYRRYALILLTVAALGVSYALAVPRFKRFRQDQISRQEIRQQFKEQLKLARRAIEDNRGTDAALDLLRAEFPTQTERHLFRESQFNMFQQQIDDARVGLQGAVESEERTTAARMRLALIEDLRADMNDATSDRSRETLKEMVQHLESSTTPISFGSLDSPCFGDSTELLHGRAVTLLRIGNFKQALLACEDIIRRHPRLRFESGFWKDAQMER